MRIKKIIKNNLKVLVGMIIGTMVTGTGVYAATVINASDVSYSNASSGMTSTNVQGAIDELYSDSKKNLDFIDETVGADFAHDVFASYYSDACLKGNVCTWYAMAGGNVLGSCVGSCVGSCTSSCMSDCKNSCTDDTTTCMNKCNSKCNGMCTDGRCAPNPKNPSDECYNKACSKDQTVMVNLDNSCNEKCSNNDACYKSCLRKAVGNTECADFYLANK